ncbi:MAG: hypothetical protein ABL984_12850 [Pyrinomonadaceae bacterium]
MATKKTETRKTTKAAPKKASASASSSKSAGKNKPKTAVARSNKKPAKGILRTATAAVSDAIAGVAKPATAGLKAGTTVFLQEVAGSITGKSAKSAAANSAVAASAKPKTKSASKKSAAPTARPAAKAAGKKPVSKKNK